MRTLVRLSCAAALLTLSGAPAFAQSTSTSPDELSMATLEQLMNIEITSASRTVQRVDNVPSAVFVLTQEDIRRSGMTRLPELLRLVPGVQVAQINTTKWAVSVRGSNDAYSDKLLVLIDGRTVYTRMFAGVIWDAEDLMLENIDRIEVIRGPGASIWGANAVNGVINIVTKSSAETQGTTVRIGAGTFDQTSAAIRHGGVWGPATYRAYTQWGDGGETRSNGVEANDRLRTVTGGFRLDYDAGSDAFLFDTRVSTGRATALWFNFDPATIASAPISMEGTDTLGGAMVARWTRTLRSGASFQLQSSLDADHRDEPVAHYDRRAIDVDAQYHSKIGARHDVVTGAAFRNMEERFDGRNGYSLNPAAGDINLVSAFVQDEITLVPQRLSTTVGTKVEHDSRTGGNVQPTARVMWHIVPRQQHAWAALSRALRTPSLTEQGIRVDYAPLPTAAGIPVALRLQGNPDYDSETLLETEAGYRADLGSTAAIDVAAYQGAYRHSRSLEPLAPEFAVTPFPHVVQPLLFDTLARATARGLELGVQWQPSASWRFDGSVTTFHMHTTLSPSSGDPETAAYRGDAPGVQWQLHAGRMLSDRLRLDAQLFHAGHVPVLDVPAYTRADVRLELKVNQRWSIAAVGQNLLDPEHVEFSSYRDNVAATQIPRSAGLWLSWRM